MAAPPISSTTRYYAVGKRKYYWVTTIGNKAAPTRGELNAGIDVSGEVASVAGFTTSSATIDAPDYGSRFTSKVSGRIATDDSSLTFYATSNSSDVRSVITLDATGFVVILLEGDVTGQKMDVWPVKVTAVSKPNSDADAAQIVISFAATSQAATDVTIP